MGFLKKVLPGWYKYGDLTKRAFISSITYRSEVVLWFFLDLLPIVVLMFVWVSVYQGTDQIYGFSLGQVLQYYFLVMVINALTAHHFEQYRVKQIREGKIDFYLTRPLTYLAEIAWHAVGGKLFYGLVTVALASCSWLVLQAFFPVSSLTLTLPTILQFALLMIGGYLIEYFLALTIVLLGFWFENAEGLEHFKWIVVTLFSGHLIPIAFMPEWMKQVTLALPFKFISALPIGIMQQTTSITQGDWLYLCSFIAALWIFTTILWRAARYKYSSAGG
jgi:ABC-2 type transport system permease protein